MTTTTVPTTDLLTEELLARFDERGAGLRPGAPLLPGRLRRAPRAGLPQRGGPDRVRRRRALVRRGPGAAVAARVRRAGDGLGREHALLLDRRRGRPVGGGRPVVRVDAARVGRRRGVRRRPRRGGQRHPAADVVERRRAGRRRLGDHRPQDLRLVVTGMDVPRSPRARHERPRGTRGRARVPAARCGALPHRPDVGRARHARDREQRHDPRPHVHSRRVRRPRVSRRIRRRRAVPGRDLRVGPARLRDRVPLASRSVRTTRRCAACTAARRWR